jgi:uncharacterized protein (DUF1015 family)
MAKIFPFRSLRYSQTRVPIDKVVTQPYDKISKDMQDRYYSLHPNNIIRIILGRSSPEDTSENNVYTRAAAYLREWRSSGVLEQLPAPAFFVYYQSFAVPGTTEIRTRKGFVGAGQLEEYKERIIFPHERTLTGPKKDRLELLRHTRTQFEQIFMLYEDPAQTIDSRLDEFARKTPDIEVLDEYGVQHTVWIVSDPAAVDFVRKEMADKKLIIADGHHRYETALAYREEMRAKNGSDRMPMTFFNMNSPGLTILPTHRVIANLAGFDVKSLLGKAREYFDVVTSNTGDAVTIGVFADGKESFLRLRPSLDLATLMPDQSPNQRKLDVVALHRLILEKCLGINEDAVKKESHITYVRGRDAAVKIVQEGKGQVAFLLNPTRLDQMRDIAYEGNVMPQKSTDFYPKVLSGLTMYVLE